MKQFVLNFEQFVNENYSSDTNEFFSFKKREFSPIQKELDTFIDIIGKLSIEYDPLYDKSEAQAKQAKSIDELLLIIEDVLQTLNEITFLKTSEAIVKQELETFKKQIQPMASVVYEI